MATHNWNKALEHLNKAVALAPQYVTAYNNLGVLYDKMNDIPHEEEGLQKAVSLDGHFAPALLNYGKLCLRQKNPVQAETLLQRAASSDPNDAEIVTLLSFAEYMNRHFVPTRSAGGCMFQWMPEPLHRIRDRRMIPETF